MSIGGSNLSFFAEDKTSAKDLENESEANPTDNDHRDD